MNTMETKPVFQEDIHFEHARWNSELEFWKDELKTYENRLAELTRRRTEKAVLAKLEQYQNHFFIHKTKIEELLEGIQGHEINMAAHFKAEENVLDRIHYQRHLEFRKMMNRERTMIADLKKEFFEFLSENR